MAEGKKQLFFHLILTLITVTVCFLASGAWQEQESPAARRVLSDDYCFITIHL